MALMAEEPPLGDLADPNNTNFIPIPDWYFLFLYQLLKFEWAGGPFIVIGTVVIPGIAFTALLLAPWLDRSKERRPLKRPIATGLSIAIRMTESGSNGCSSIIASFALA